jgi:hypothetical protein
MHVTLMHQGEFGPVIEHYEKALALYDPEHHREDAFFTQNAGVALRCFGAWTLWFLGFPDQALSACMKAECSRVIRTSWSVA